MAFLDSNSSTHQVAYGWPLRQHQRIVPGLIETGTHMVAMVPFMHTAMPCWLWVLKSVR